jgi:DNA-binding NtrC family response regulator
MTDEVLLLIACSDLQISQRLADPLRDAGLKPIYSSTVEESAETVARYPVALALCEDALPGGGYEAFLDELKCWGKTTPVIVVSGTESWEKYAVALRSGAVDVIFTPFQVETVNRVVFGATPEFPLPLGRAAAGSRRTGSRKLQVPSAHNPTKSKRRGPNGSRFRRLRGN